MLSAMRRIALVALAGIAGCGTPKPPAQPAALTAKDIVKSSTPAIVRIQAGDHLGTGFILDRAGVVATNLHVVAGVAEIQVKLFTGEVYPVMQIVGVDLARDLALLRIVPAKPLPVLTLGDSDAMTAGDAIYTIGNPLGVFDYSVTNGLVSARRPICEPHRRQLLLLKTDRTPDESRELEELRDCTQELTVLQISAPISQGSSGGPLFNQAGEVVGVTTAIITASQAQSINLAVPTNYLKPMLAQPGAISLDDFARATRSPDQRGQPDDDGIVIVRKVPNHPITVFDGCGETDLRDVVTSIEQAIESGAPLYNLKTPQGYEACYRIYEGTATKYEHDAACAGVRTAFGDGLLRASSMQSYKEKAWAMRDTFDGLTDVAGRWMQAPHATPKKKPKR
jgi:serine protease Do